MQDLSTPQDELLTSGPRVGTYWQVTLRQRHPAGHPALRELFLLATAIDKIRSGHLLESLFAALKHSVQATLKMKVRTFHLLASQSSQGSYREPGHFQNLLDLSCSSSY